MGFVKKYGVWIAVGVALLVILIVQLVVVGGRRAEALETNEDASKEYIQLKGMANNLEGVPTRTDIEAAKKHIDSIKAMGVEVRETWRTVTGGLNKYMSNGEREEGTVIDPRDPDGEKVISAALFAEEINSLYASLFETMRAKLAERMEPKLAIMIADSQFGSNRKLTSEEAARTGKLFAAQRAPKLANIVQGEKITPVPLSARYDPPNPPEKMWKDWRAYLIAHDIFGRVVPQCEAEVTRTVSTLMPATDEERAALSSERDEFKDPMAKTNNEPKPEPPRVSRELKGWRYIEQVKEFKVQNLKPGTAELPARQPAEGEATPAAAKPATPTPPPVPGVPGIPAPEVRYYDSFTVEISFVAHIKVVQVFMSELLRSEGIWYVPVSSSIKPLVTTETSGDYAEAEKKRWNTVKGLGALKGVVVPLQKVAGFEHEPPVEAKLTYRVYRFRYEDTDNPPADMPSGTGGRPGMPIN